MIIPFNLELTQQLVCIDTRNSPVDENEYTDLLAGLLCNAGMEINAHARQR